MKKIYIDFPFISLLGLICVLISLFLLFVSLPKSNDEYISFNRTVESISIKDNAMHTKFIEDDIDYVFYEYGDVTFEDLNDINNGDKVEIFVAKNYQEPKYAIIYKLVVDNRVIFDSMEYHYHHDMAIVNVFAPTVIGLLLTYILIFVFSIKVKEEKVEVKDRIDYIIKNPINHISISIVFTVFGMVSFLSFLIQYLCKFITTDFFNYSYVFLFFALLGLLLIYVLIVENFKLENGIYSYRHPFKKQSIKTEDIDHVEIYLPSASLYKVTFYDTNGKKAIRFRDDGSAFTNGYFLRSLKNNKIKYEYRTKTEVIQK